MSLTEKTAQLPLLAVKRNYKSMTIKTRTNLKLNHFKLGNLADV